MESISHEDTSPTFVGEVDGLAVFGAAPEAVNSAADAPHASDFDTRQEAIQALAPRSMSRRGVGLVMTSPTIHAPGARPSTVFMRS